jgi:integrase
MPATELPQPESPVILAPATEPIRRKRGKSLSRRVGQNGNVFQRGFTKSWNPAATAYGRYWIDVPGVPERKRRTVVLGVCSSRSTARWKLRAHIEREGINSKASFALTTAPAMTFRDQAARWLATLATRRRRPLKPATVSNWKHSLDKWVLPTLGDRLLADISNGALRELVEKMAEAGLAAKSIVNHAAVVKLVIASAVDADGDQLYPRKWNHDFVGLPIVKKEDQHRPTVTESEIGEILASAQGRYFALFALLAGTGLRIGEALALKDTSLSPDCRIAFVRKSIWRGKEQEPKTPNAVREVDLPKPLATFLQEYVAGKSGYLFATASGRPLAQRNVLRALHATGKKVGLHAFRRFRTETLRRAGVPRDLESLWIGHAKATVGDLYAGGLQRDLAWRTEWCKRAGLGFAVGHVGLQKVVPIDSVRAA